MKKIIVVAVIFGMINWGLPGKAQEQDLSGFTISAMFGGSFCVKNSSATCTDIDPSFGVSVSPSLRISNYVGLGADFIYGMYDLSGVNAANIGLTFGPILYLPLDHIDLFIGIGLGWMRLYLEADGSHGAADGFGLSLQSGFEYRVVENLGLGIMFRLNFNLAGEFCSGGDCITIDHVAHNAIIGATLSIHF